MNLVMNWIEDFNFSMLEYEIIINFLAKIFYTFPMLYILSICALCNV